MSQAILISDNEVINSLYELNLRAYVATNVTVKKSIDGAIKLVEQSPNIDAIICFRELNNKDNSFEKLKLFLTEKSLAIPMVVMGEPGTALANAIVIKNKYDIKSLLRSMAKILEITAKDMADKEVPQYFPIPLKLFSQIETSHCDIYFRNQKENFEYEYFKIIEAGTPIADKLTNYSNQGVKHLFIDADQRLKFINKTSGMVIEELNREDISSSERLEITAQGMGIVAEEIFESKVLSEQVAQISTACSESIAKVAKDVPQLKVLLGMLLENKSDFVYSHSVISTYFATNIIKNISWGSKEQAEKVTFVLFFHDIFLVPIYRKYPDAISEEDLMFRSDVSDKDKNVVLEHARLAGELIKTFPRCPMGADMIVTQHHGMTNGVGFAVNYKDDISPLSKIIIIAEEAATMVLNDLSKQTEKKKIPLKKDKIIAKLNEKFKNHTYKKLVATFDSFEI